MLRLRRSHSPLTIHVLGERGLVTNRVSGAFVANGVRVLPRITEALRHTYCTLANGRQLAEPPNT